MSKSNVLLTNDQMQYEIRDGYEDSVDFFVGNKISIEKKETKKDDNTVETLPPDTSNEINYQKDGQDVSGLESLILGFGKGRTPTVNGYAFDIDGQESIISTGKTIIDAIWQFIKDIGNWVYELFTNRIARLDARIKFTTQQRKLHGIKSGFARYPVSVKRLFVPSMVSANSIWVNNAVKESEKFYLKVIEGHKQLKDFIKEKPNTPDEYKRLQERILNTLGKTITGNPSRNGLYQTNILPGNRIFNIKISTSANSDEILTYFTESSALVKLKIDTWEPTQSIIDEAITTLGNFINNIKKEQQNTSTLITNFNSELKSIKNKNKTISKETKKYYIWLGNLNKRLSNTTLQYVTYCIEALDDFVNSGVK